MMVDVMTDYLGEVPVLLAERLILDSKEGRHDEAVHEGAGLVARHAHVFRNRRDAGLPGGR